MPQTPYLDALTRDGFVLIPNFLTPEEIKYYRAATTATIPRAHRGEWPHVRTTKKQFPPYESATEGIWGREFGAWCVLPKGM